MKKFAAILVWALALAFLTFRAAAGYTCNELSSGDTENYKGADVVFVGYSTKYEKVIQEREPKVIFDLIDRPRTTSKAYVRFTFTITKVLKGDIVNTVQVYLEADNLLLPSMLLRTLENKKSVILGAISSTKKGHSYNPPSSKILGNQRIDPLMAIWWSTCSDAVMLNNSLEITAPEENNIAHRPVVEVETPKNCYVIKRRGLEVIKIQIPCVEE